MATLLFEIGTEELPSWYVEQGRNALVDLARERLGEARLTFDEVIGWSTPRRLTVRVSGLAEQRERRVERRRGPSAEVAFDADGAPTKAATGFARGLGVDPNELMVEETDRGRYVFANVASGGEPALEILPEMLADWVRDLPAPRKMRWGEVDVPFVRPIAWLLARLDGDVVPVEVAGVRAGTTTRGHRFEAPDEVELGSLDDYLDLLRSVRVLADPAERRDATATAIADAAEAEGLQPYWDERLLREVVDLVEWPTAIVGRFDTRYLVLPDEVLATVMIHHQRFVPLRTDEDSIAARFVGISNTEANDLDAVRSGYEAVLDGRLYDARFFWDADRSKTLSQHAWALSGIAFQKQLGSMADKITRVREVAPRLAEELEVDDEVAGVLDAALPVFRADLATEMVYELPELEGVMARAYAVAEGQPAAVAQALEDGVRPHGPGGRLPEGDAGAILAACDRADKLLGFFSLGKRPSGSADPFGLRRDATALARIAAARDWPVSLGSLLTIVAAGYRDGPVEIDEAAQDQVAGFVWDRVTSLLVDEGIGVTTVRAATTGDPSVILAARRAHLLAALSGTEAFDELMTLYKRAANLSEGAAEDAEADPEKFDAPQEGPLFEALPVARSGVTALLKELQEQLPAWSLGQGPNRTPEPGPALARVLSLKDPLDRFLDDVHVMVDDAAVRDNRLALLREVRGVLRRLGGLEQLGG